MPKKALTRSKKFKKSIIEANDLCVRCGLCLPHCPTYQISEQEPESPRGRIAIAKGLAEGKIPITNAMQQHLNNCLSCLACEAMCPAKVPYHDLLINTRALQVEQKSPSIPRLLNLFLKHLRLTKQVQWLIKIYRKSHLQTIFTNTSLQKYNAFIPNDFAIASFKTEYRVQNSKGSVALFTGCINPLCDGKTLHKLIQLLNKLRFNVFIPHKTYCCGAIHLHNGNPEMAESFALKNAKSFSQYKHLTAIITVASGCHDSFLKIQSSIENTPPILNILQFLREHLPTLKQELSFSKAILNEKILIHTPCSLKNAMHEPNLLIEVLQSLGFKNLLPLKGYGCCGAAGLNMWNNPTLAKTIAEPLIEEILNAKTKTIISANLSCQLHLNQLLLGKNQNLRVIDLINLIIP